MGSVYLAKVFNSEGDSALDIALQLRNITEQTNLLKTLVKTTFHEGKINLERLLNNNTILAMEAGDLSEKMSKLQLEIDSAIKSELSNCTAELNELSNALQEIQMTMMFLVQLSEMHSLIHRADGKLKNKEFYECAKLIREFKQMMREDGVGLKYTDLYNSLANECVKCTDKLLKEINALWGFYVKFDVEVIKEIKLSKLQISSKHVNVITDILQATDCLEHTSVENDFVSKFMNAIVNDVIMHKVVIRELNYGGKALSVEILHTTKKPVSTEVFKNLKDVLDFLIKNFDIEIMEDLSFLNKVGHNIGTELVNSLVKNFLVKIIPNSTVELKKYDEIMKSAEDFDVYLKEIGFLPEDSTMMLEHKKTVNDLFIERFTVTHLDKARSIMKKDLNKIAYSEDMVITSLDKLPPDCVDIIKNKFLIAEPTYLHLKSQISKSAEEVSDMAKQIMLEAMRSKDDISVPIFNTMLNIFEIYSAVVPLHHKKFLETIPLQAGLFHNNCLYLAYYLVNLGSEFYGKVSPILQNHFHRLFETAAAMRALAKEKFEEHITSQNKTLTHTLKYSALVTLEENPNVNLSNEGCVRHCMRQLQALDNTWKDLLPSKVYNRVMGFFLDSAIDTIIGLIMAAEDLPSKTAEDLVLLMKPILEKAPPLFTDPKEIVKHCSRWLKLNEFITVLKGSLKDVDERWSDGMGPLANEFTPQDVKKLVRALFRNSDRRSELLNKIK